MIISPQFSFLKEPNQTITTLLIAKEGSTIFEAPTTFRPLEPFNF